jgi:RNA polymerase sigma factor (sigma-70 family)
LAALKDPDLDLAGLFIANRAQLRHAAMKIIGTREQADDIVQDAYVKLLEMAAAFDIRQPLAYLFQLVRNLAIDRHRRGSFETRVFAGEEDGMHVASGAGTPEAVAINTQQLRLVAEALATLPERTRRAFELHRLGGKTQREVADQLGVSTTLVNFMVRDALTCCRNAIEPV